MTGVARISLIALCLLCVSCATGASGTLVLSDGGFDAGPSRDAGDDAGTDAGVLAQDGGSDGGPDAGVFDAGTDAGVTVGAIMPFTTLEAEDSNNLTNGNTVRLVGLPTPTNSSPELEASGRAFVELDADGDYLEFPNAPEANTLVVRHCIPDAPEGGGISATLGLYVNGTKRQSLLLSSRHNWLYGAPSNNGQSNNPDAGEPHVYWEESRFFIDGGVQAGDSLRLEKDRGDDAGFYRIDLIDLERVGPPSGPPAAGTYLDVTTYGADPTGAQDSTAALVSALAAGKAQGKIVWLPPGVFTVSGQLTADSVQVVGAGMWATTIFRNVPLPRTGGSYSMVLTGADAGVSDLFIDSSAVGRNNVDGSDFAFLGNADNWTLESVWMTHTGTGPWMSGSHGTVHNCRVRFTYADGINLNNGIANSVVENNHVRGSGDDGIAILSEVGSPLSQSVTVRHNTVSATWWGGNIDIAGGEGHAIENNLLADNSLNGCLVLNLPPAYPMLPLTSTILTGNLLLRCGGNGSGQERGAVWIYPGSNLIDNVFFQSNSIIAPLFRGFHLVGNKPQNITFDQNFVDMQDAGLEGFVIAQGAIGSGVFLNNTVANENPASPEFSDPTGEDAGYMVTAVGDSWSTGH